MIEPEANMTRLHELFADRATQCLSVAEERELTALMGHDRDDSSFDRAAAALDVPYLLLDDEPLPARLRARLEADAARWMRNRQA